MRTNRKVTKKLLILYGVCAIVWWIYALMKLSSGAAEWDAGLNLFCAVVWTFAFIVWTRRYKTQQENNSESGGAE